MTGNIRLKKEKDFVAVFNKGKRIYSKDLTLIYLPKESIKVGFAVSKKHGKSVVRNKIKRLLRESFRSFLPKIEQNFFFVFLPKISDEYSLEKFKSSMQYVLVKGGIIKND